MPAPAAAPIATVSSGAASNPVPNANVGAGTDQGNGNALQAAIARTATRGAALYFSRPVRLFRPSKISGWASLKGLALRDGRDVDARFLRELVNTKGMMVIPKHFLPPLLMNAALGTVLWTTYAEVSSVLEDHVPPVPAAFLAGAAAGGAQALAAAPAENIRLALEGGTGGFAHAWRAVFASSAPAETQATATGQARRVREWMGEVRGMAGRGWAGWGWTLGKDAAGFSLFFAIFEGTRAVAVSTTALAQDYADRRARAGRDGKVQRNAARVVHGATLVGGGVCAGLAYELACRPWDAARRLVLREQIRAARAHASRRWIVSVLARKVADDGLLSLFRAPVQVASDGATVSAARRRMHAALRTLGRVGPWGFGFLVWEAYGPGLGLPVS